MLPTFCPLTIDLDTISLEFCGKPSILAADDLLGACCRKIYDPPKAMDFTFFSRTNLYMQLFGDWDRGGQNVLNVRGGEEIAPKVAQSKTWTFDPQIDDFP